MSAEMIVKGSAIFTSTTLETIEGAIIIENGVIADIVALDEADKFAGPDTVVIDAGDRLVTPGFNDAHTHFVFAGISKDPDSTLDLEGVEGKEACLATIKAYAESHPDNKWIVGANLDYDCWGEEKPRKEMLDSVVPDRPVYIASWDLHVGWVNSLALEAAGYVKGCPDIEGGVIYRDEDGTPNGLLAEPPVCDPVFGMGNGAADMDRVLPKTIEESLSYGVTATGMVYPYGGMDEVASMETLQEAERAGKLPVRISIFLKLQKDYTNVERFSRELTSDHLRFAGLKQVTDGVCEAHTGYLTEPYADDPTTCGEPAIGYDELLDLVLEADARNYPVRLHTIGNGAVKQALDVFEEVQRQHGRKGLRNTLEHIESCRPEDMPRFAKLGVVPSMQPMHAVLNTDGYPVLLGEKWVPYMWPVKSLMNEGAIMAFGTDAPVWKLKVVDGLYAAVTRARPWDKEPAGGFVPEQKVSLAEAIQAYTFGSAYAETFEHKIGTLAPGMLADLVVFDRNLFDIPVDEIPEANVDFTVVDGRIVYHAADAQL